MKVKFIVLAIQLANQQRASFAVDAAVYMNGVWLCMFPQSGIFKKKNISQSCMLFFA